MAKIPSQTTITPITIDKFLGLNISNTGDTQIKLGESGNMENFYITNDYKLKKMYGYKSFYDFTAPINGMTSVTLNKIKYLLVSTDGKLYYFLSDELENEEAWEELEAHEIGIVPNKKCSFFVFDNKVYILCGKYMSWDGTTLQEVEGYIPKVFISTPPTGGGTEFEEINLLTGKKHQTFNADGTSTQYQLAETNIDSVEKVFVNGVQKSAAMGDYTYTAQTGIVEFRTAPETGMDNVDIYWTKTPSGSRALIENMRFGTIFGGNVDTRVFLYGNDNERNRIRYSGITEEGIPTVEYFPTFAQLDVGPKNFAVTDLTRQYDRLLVTTNKPEAYYLSLDTIQIDEDTTTTSIQTLPLNEVHGNIAMGQGQVINNDPVTIENGAIIRWKATNVRDERNMSDISQKIKLDLIGLNLTNMKTLDHQTENQLWLVINNKIYIYNYFNDTYSKVRLYEDIAHITEMNSRIYMCNELGKLVVFGEEFDDFDGLTINARWEMDFYDFETPYLRKTMKKLWVLMQPQAKASAEIGYITNKNESPIKKKIEYSLVLLDNVDFGNFEFGVSNNPQPFRLKLKAKKFTNLKIVIENKEKTDCTILALSLRVETGGESK